MFKNGITEEYKFNPSLRSVHIKSCHYVHEGSRVFDVGCNNGFLGKELKKKRCSLFGVDIDPGVVAKAESIYEKTITADLDGIERFPFPLQYFDAIICNDILEHLKRPDILLTKLKPYLNKNGLMIITIPNVARIEYRIQHLFGNFDYEPLGGILYTGHLRFFTLKSIKKMLNLAGYKIIKVDYTGLASRIKILPNLFAFQFIILAKAA